MQNSKRNFFETRTRRVQYILATVVFVASLIISLYLAEQNSKKREDEFILLSQQITQLVNDRVDYYTQLLLGGLGLFQASTNVTRQEWKRFSDAQMLDSKFLGIQGVGYSKVIFANELKKHTQQIHDEGFTEYYVKPKGERELYTSIVYLEPFNERNQRAFGYDMYSEQTRRAAMQKAIETGQPSLSGKVRLLQENGIDEQAGFLLYLPYYKPNMPLRNKQQRYGAIEGFVYAPFRAKNFFENIAANMTQSIGIEIYDNNGVDESALLLRSFDVKRVTKQTLRYTTTLIFGDQVWTLRFTQLEHTNDISDFTPMIIVISGLFVTILVFLLLENLAKFQERQRDYYDKLQSLSFKQSLALKAANMGMWEVDYKTHKHIWDLKMYDIFDIHPNHKEEIIELWSAKILHNEQEDEKRKLLSAITNRSSYDSKFWIRHTNGQKRYVHTMALCEFDSDGQALRMVGTCIDITEQKMLEMQLQNKQEAILEVKTTGFVHFHGREFFWTNRAFEEMLGYGDGELQAKHFKDIIEDEMLYSNYKETITNALNRSGSFSGEISVKRKDGSKGTLLVAITKLKETINESMAVIMDISLQKDLEANLQNEVTQKTKENLRQLQVLQNQNKLASMGEMMGAIAHQWRQPLNEISIRIQKIEFVYSLNKLDQAYIDDFVSKNRKTIDFMSKTIDNFRNFFRIDKEQNDFSIKDSIEEVLSIQSAQLESHNIKTILQGDDFIEHGYKTELQQVILNILSNAKDALIQNQTPEPKITITLLRKSIVISDNGGGVDEEIIERLFEPYFTTKEEGKGTGMGLYISKMIIEENMFGTLEIENRDNGAAVTINFPL